MDGKPPAPAGSSKGGRWGLGRDVALVPGKRCGRGSGGARAPHIGKRPLPHIEGGLIKPLLFPKSPQVTTGAAPGRVLLQEARRPIFKRPILSAAGFAGPRRWSGRGEETSFRLSRPLGCGKRMGERKPRRSNPDPQAGVAGWGAGGAKQHWRGGGGGAVKE